MARRELLQEAAEWLVRLQSEEKSAALAAEFERWRGRSPDHAAAWRSAESVLQSFRQLPGGIGRQTLSRIRGEGRRRLLRGLGAVALAAPGAWLLCRQRPWDAWQADYRTAVGERQTVHLADGSHLTLNTASAVDVRFSDRERRLRLVAGEVLIATARDPLPLARPFVVQTGEGELRPLGTRFSVRQLSGATRLAVYEGAVEIAAGGGRQVLHAGEQAVFDARRTGATQPASDSDTLWREGMLVARNMRLADWVEEIGRYRPGVLRCHPAVAELRVSGAFPLDDTDASLDALVRTRPLALRSATRYWVSLEPPG